VTVAVSGHRREPILARLLELAKAVQGIAAAERNVLDLTKLARPGIAIRDGGETPTVLPRNERRVTVQLMQMTPGVIVYVGAGAKEAGTLANLYLGRLLAAVNNDSDLLALTGTNGEIRYEGASLEDPEPEGREARMEIALVFVYPFDASAL
jgi:hypothetical protein